MSKMFSWNYGFFLRKWRFFLKKSCQAPGEMKSTQRYITEMVGGINIPIKHEILFTVIKFFRHMNLSINKEIWPVRRQNCPTTLPAQIEILRPRSFQMSYLAPCRTLSILKEEKSDIYLLTTCNHHAINKPCSNCIK